MRDGNRRHASTRGVRSRERPTGYEILKTKTFASEKWDRGTQARTTEKLELPTHRRRVHEVLALDLAIILLHMFHYVMSPIVGAHRNGSPTYANKAGPVRKHFLETFRLLMKLMGYS